MFPYNLPQLSQKLRNIKSLFIRSIFLAFCSAAKNTSLNFLTLYTRFKLVSPHIGIVVESNRTVQSFGPADHTLYQKRKKMPATCEYVNLILYFVGKCASFCSRVLRRQGLLIAFVACFFCSTATCECLHLLAAFVVKRATVTRLQRCKKTPWQFAA